MKKIRKLISAFLVVMLLCQTIIPAAASIDMNYTQITAHKSADKGKIIQSSESFSDLSEDEAALAGVDLSTADTTAAPIIGEIPELRSANTKHFRRADGTFTMVTYAEPIHYQDQTGKWQEIDNTLSLQSNGTANGAATYQTAASAANISIPQSLANNQQITLEKDGYTVSLALQNSSQISASANAQVQNNVSASDENRTSTSAANSETPMNEDEFQLTNQSSMVTYQNVLPDTDFEYIVTSSKLKESIIVNKKQSHYAYTFTLSFGSLIPAQQADGSIKLFANTGDADPVFILEAPYMIDAEDNISTNVTMTLNNNTLTLTADADWINAQERAFPVVIDPTVVYYDDIISDAYVSTFSKNLNYNSGIYAYAGKWNVGVRRTYMKLPLPTLPEGSVVTDASLAIKQYYLDRGPSGNLYAFDLTGKSSWSTSSITWNNQPLSTAVNGPQTDGTTILDYTAYRSGSGIYYYFNITNAVKNWYENGTNNGIALASSDENVASHSTMYSSRAVSTSNMPALTINYINHIGLEDYWPYKSFDFGRSGAAYVNAFNGSLTYTHSDLNMTGNRLPISIGHVYNSNNSDIFNTSYPGMKVGTNFKLNIQEILTAISSSEALYDNGYRYRYYDSDGTLHYFMNTNVNGTTKMTLEFDSNVVLTEENSNCVISDAQGNKKYFNAQGQLFKTVDNNGNIQTITISGNQITKITDPVGREVTFTYNASSFLTGITDPAGRTTSFAYNTNGNLTGITYPGGKQTGYTYSANSLSKVTAIDGAYYTFAYRSTFGCGKRVSHVYQYDKANNQMEHLTFEYTKTNESGVSSGNTLITDKTGKFERYLFDGYGRATELINQYLQAQFMVYGSDINNRNEFNNLLDKSELQTIATNLLKNHGFERADYWSALQASSNGTYGYSTEESSSGSRSMKAELTSDSGIIELGQDFNAKAGDAYTVSVDIKIPEALTVSGENGVTFGFAYCINDAWYTDRCEWISSTYDWERFTHTMSLPTGTLSSCRVFIELANAEGTVYFDNIQVERSGGSRYYNLVENSNFANAPQATSVATGAQAYAWTGTNLQTGDGVQVVGTRNYFLAEGSISHQKKLSQTIPVNAQAGETLIIGGRAGAYATTSDPNRKYAIIADIYSSETTKVDTIEIPFDRYINMEHQMKASFYQLTTPCHHIVYSFVYYNHPDGFCFDDAFVYVGSFGNHYEYDSSGNLIKESNDEGAATAYTYANSDVVEISRIVSGKEETVADIVYDTAHNATKMTNNIGTEIAFTYQNGQVVSQTMTENADSTDALSSTESYTYIQNGNYVKTYTDANGGVTTYTYDNNDQPLKGLVVKVQDPNGNETHYTYDANTDELISVSGNADASSTAVVQYTTQDFLPKTITRNGTTYSYEYDSKNRVTASKVGNQTLVSTTYDSSDRLSQQLYANGDSYIPVYDYRDRDAGERWNHVQTIRHFYNENDRRSQTIDLTTNVTYKYEYAFYGLLLKIIGSDGTKTAYDYDMSGQLSHYTFTKDNEVIYDARFTTDEKGNPEDVILRSLDNALLHYNYDGVGRLTGYSNGSVIHSLEYAADAASADSAVQKHTMQDRNGNTLYQHVYTYDANGNIVQIGDTVNEKTTAYTYDGLNRLTSESNGTDTLSYTYDIGGNVTAVSKNNTVLHTYTYGNTNWKDQLTAIDGKGITYDQSGNPLSYDGQTYTWQRGTQLAGISDSEQTISFVYDAQGNRISKTVNSATTNYLYSGDLLMRQTDGTNVIDFAYDSSGQAVGFKLNGTAYYYAKNLQGDVVAVLNGDGGIVAQYSYDAYGNLLSSSGTLAQINPIRYRGYYYDTETGLYYLKARYYNPEWRRFLNADTLFVAGDDAINGSNMYAYCYDNPVMYVDPEGTTPGLFAFFENLFKQIANNFAQFTGTVNWFSNRISVGISELKGENIMTPIADLFMSSVAPITMIVMELIYSRIPGGNDWESINYPFSQSNIDGFYFLQLRQYFPKNMSILAPIGASYLDFHLNIDCCSPNFGNYTTIRGSYQWQKDVGYCWWYDWFFNLGGQIGKVRMPFENGPRYYIVWCWKGDYWNLGAGAEIGIYYTNYIFLANAGYYDIDPANLQLHVCMNVDYEKSPGQIQHLTSNFEQTNWWVTSFTPSIQSPNVDNLHVNITFSFFENNIHNGLLSSFRNRYTNQEWLQRLDDLYNATLIHLEAENPINDKFKVFY